MKTRNPILLHLNRIARLQKMKRKLPKAFNLSRLAITVTMMFLLAINHAYGVGATTPFTSFEAESGTLGGGAIVRSLSGPPTNEFSSPELESSGRAFVELKSTGQTIKWTNNTAQSFTAMNVRFSIPDSSGGGGITNTLNLYVNGVFRQTVALNSAQSWVYETASDYNGMNQSPSAGFAHGFFDETHFFITGAPIAPGSTFKFQQDSGNTAAFYWIDVVDMETPPAPLSQPANSLSIVTYGAVPNNPAVDSSTAIQNCFNDAYVQNKTAWIPQGTFYINKTGGLNATGITIAGAGMWYSTLYHNVPLPVLSGGVGDLIDPVSCTLEDFAIDSDATSRKTSDGDGGAINISGSGWLVERVWVQHTGSGVWGKGDHGTVQDCRTGSTWGDGVNINNGNNGNEGDFLTVSNCFVRGANDDGLAINSDASSSIMTTPTIANCTSVSSWWGHALGIYGGTNVIVTNCLLCDPAKAGGTGIGTFNGQSLFTCLFQGNTILRGGGDAYGSPNAALAIGTSHTDREVANVTANANSIIAPIFQGVDIQITTNLIFSSNTVSQPGTLGINILATSFGNGAFNNNVVDNLNSGYVQFTNYAGSAFSASQTNNSWQLVVMDGVYKLINRNSGLALDAKGQNTTNGTPIEQYTYNGGANQQWAVTNIGSSYEIIGVQSGRSLDVKGQSTADGAAIQLYDYNGGANQQWIITSTSGGYCTVQGVQSGKLMEVVGAATTNSAPVDQWSNNGGNNQQWSFQAP